MTVILFFPHGRLFSRSKTEMKASRLTLYSDDSQQVQHFDSQTAQQNNDYSLQSVLALLLSFHSSFLLWISCSLWSPVLFIQNIILKNSLFFPNDRLCKQLPSFVDLNTETCTHLHLFISFYPPISLPPQACLLCPDLLLIPLTHFCLCLHPSQPCWVTASVPVSFWDRNALLRDLCNYNKLHSFCSKVYVWAHLSALK